MKTVPILLDQVEDILTKILGEVIELKSNGSFFKFQLHDTTYLSYTSLDREGDIPVGILIAEQTSTTWSLYPSILPLLSDLPRVVVKDRQTIVSLSKGNSVLLDSDHKGLQIVTDRFERLVALVRIDGDTAQPLVDIGFYLRNE